MGVDEAVAGFDWDAGNREKCQRHGVSIAEIEAMFKRPLAIRPDDRHSATERRFLAVGRTAAGRWVFLAFTHRDRSGKVLIRPITARFMHRQEVRQYEEENPDI
jgi:hypothetical protein